MQRSGAVPGGPIQSKKTVGNSGVGEGLRTPFLTARQFLKLSQPVVETSLPTPRIAEKGRRYTFPFVFVVPERLLSTACSHRHKNAAVEDAHLRLPPSLNDGTTPLYGGYPYDDISPDMTLISYAITVRVLKYRGSDNQIITIAEQSRKIHILPAYEDLPPAVLEPADKDIVLRQERKIRKGFLKGKLGKLTVEAQQPSPLHTTTNAACPPTTKVPLTLTFYPAGAASGPPALNSISTKLRTNTFFSTNPIMYIPAPRHIGLDGALGRHYESSYIGVQNLSGVKWTPHSEVPGGSINCYTTKLTVPIVAPKGKYLVPTFHSCFISRQYSIDVHIDVNTPRYNMGTHPGVTLKIPLQVSNPITAEELSEEDAMDVESFFTPRRITLPTETLTQTQGPLGTPNPESGNDGGPRPLPSHVLIHNPNIPPPPRYHISSGTLTPVRIPSPMGVSPGCG